MTQSTKRNEHGFERCDWNPTLNEPALEPPRDTDCPNAATWSLGVDPNWHLCPLCVVLPRFSKLRRKVPLRNTGKITPSLALEEIDHEIKDNFLSVKFDKSRARADFDEAHRILDAVAEIIERSVEDTAPMEDVCDCLVSRGVGDYHEALCPAVATNGSSDDL